MSVNFKSLIIGTPMEKAGHRLRWMLGARQRRKHPELWELYLEEQRLLLILQGILCADSCAVDVGSHIGSFLSLLFRYAPNGKHIAFEPSFLRGQALKRKFPGAKVYNCAVSEFTGDAVFFEDSMRPGHSGLQSSGAVDGINTATYKVETRRLDDILLLEAKIDLLKLDIEGGELAALRGAVCSIRKFRPLILFECGTEKDMADRQLSRRALYEFITRQLHYDIFSFVDFLFDRGPMEFDEFRKCGLYPFRALNFVARPKTEEGSAQLGRADTT